MREEVFILDYEMISPVSTGCAGLHEKLKNNFTADRPILRCPASYIPFRKGAEVQDDLSAYYAGETEDVLTALKYDRKFELLAACYGMAAERLQRICSFASPDRIGVLVGVGADISPFDHFETELSGFIHKNLNPFQELLASKNNRTGRYSVLNNPYDLHAFYLAERLHAQACRQSILTACVSSTQAIAFAGDLVAEGKCDLAIAGGTDSLINMLALVSFGKLGVINESTDDVTCKPFDVNRSGALAGEAAGLAVFASGKFVREHKLKPLAALRGYGNTLDAYKITAPDPEGLSITRSIYNAVKRAGWKPEQIGYINAHGTGTKQNDHVELKCIEKALGPAARQIPVSSTKDRHGHAIAAAGIQELCLLLDCFRHDFIPANLHLKTPCDTGFDLVRENRQSRVRYALTSNFAFGGINTVLALENLC